MIKQQKKWIALLVVCTFLWMMHISTMPVAAAGTSGQTGVASTEQGPDYVEAVSHRAAPAKKKSMLPIILIGVGLLTITAALLYFFVLKTNYDIVGTWRVDYTNAPPFSSLTFHFSGTKKSGIWTIDVWSDTGTYTVDGKNVTIAFSAEPWIFTGKFDGKDTMSGTHAWPAISISGTWTATRLSTSSTVNPSLQAIDHEGSIIEKLQNK